MSDIDELFDRPPSGQTWFDSLSDEAKEWVRAVAEAQKERGRNVSPMRFRQRFRELFPDDKIPKADGTIRDNLDRL
jgi:hypothetical protein